MNAAATAAALKRGLQQWKQQEKKLNGTANSISKDGDVVELNNHYPPAKRTQKSEVSLDSVFSDHQSELSKSRQNIPLPRYRADGAERPTAGEELPPAIDGEKITIPRCAPGVRWLCAASQHSCCSLSDLPLPESLTGRDKYIISQLSNPIKAEYLCDSFTEVIFIVEDKITFLNHMFYAMCLHHTPSTIHSLYNRLEIVLRCNYIQVDWSLVAWNITFELITYALQAFGIREHLCELTVSSASHNSLEPNKFTENIRYFLRLMSLGCQTRNSFTPDQVFDLLSVCIKLSLDTSLSRCCLRRDIQQCIQSLLYFLSDATFQSNELVLCGKLLSLVNFHHNKVHVVNSFVPLGRRAVSFRETLAYLSLRQLIDDINEWDDADEAIYEWHLQCLSELLNTLNFSDIRDPYLTHSIVCLFDVAVGHKLQDDEDTSVLVEMTAKLRRGLNEIEANLTNPDIFVLKTLVCNTGKRWEHLISWATTLKDPFGLEEKLTPSKVLTVQSQEVAPDSDDDMGGSSMTCDTSSLANSTYNTLSDSSTLADTLDSAPVSRASLRSDTSTLVDVLNSSDSDTLASTAESCDTVTQEPEDEANHSPSPQPSSLAPLSQSENSVIACHSNTSFCDKTTTLRKYNPTHQTVVDSSTQSTDAEDEIANPNLDINSPTNHVPHNKSLIKSEPPEKSGDELSETLDMEADVLPLEKMYSAGSSQFTQLSSSQIPGDDEIDIMDWSDCDGYDPDNELPDLD